MRPYLAIIKDSFLEALASRVLWILLILITLGLACLAPLGFRSEQMTEFRHGDFLDARAVARQPYTVTSGSSVRDWRVLARH